MMTHRNTCDSANRLTGIVNGNGTVPPVDQRAYAYNSANQRTGMTNADGSYWVYQYDALGQVTNGVKKWANNNLVAGEQFGYGFDTIGNRTMALAGGDQNGANRRQAGYAANNLNEYTSRTVPGAADVIGLATNTATVWVNQTAAYRSNNYFWLGTPVNNASGPVYQTVTTLAALTNGNATNAEYGVTNIGHVFVPRTPENFGYDWDGNLTNDGHWSYYWDGENRLVAMTNNAGIVAAGEYTLAFAYDYQGRRIQKLVCTNSGLAYVPEYTNRFLYDGWNLVAILNPNASIAAAMMWGTDLSGSAQGAGGVGGLLAENLAANGVHFVAYDGNGNVTALVSASSGTVTANYEYGPFGEVIRATGPMAKVNPFMFSTKFYDWESGLYYYGYRYYNPSTGRWLSRDPKGEKGGRNLYGFVRNDPIKHIDKLGKDPCATCGPDITRALDRTLLLVEQKFWAADEDTKEAACGNLVNNPVSWDIAPLYLIGINERWPNWPFGTGVCSDSVTWRGRCVYAGSANYAFFGRACKICREEETFGGGTGEGWDLDNAILLAELWKWINGDLDSLRATEAIAFVRYGYGAPYSVPPLLGCGGASGQAVPDKDLPWKWTPLTP